MDEKRIIFEGLLYERNFLDYAKMFLIRLSKQKEDDSNHPKLSMTIGQNVSLVKLKNITLRYQNKHGYH